MPLLPLSVLAFCWLALLQLLLPSALYSEGIGG